MMTDKIVNYTAEQTAQLVANYQDGVTVERLAEMFGKTTRSVVAKLSREGVYQALVLDEVYASLENKEEKSNERLLDFTLKSSQRFLNQTFKKESISSLNLYSIKRIMTEKSLDLLEHYEVKNLDDLYQWYAIFSFELAKDYGPLLKTPLRQDQRFEYHLHWAKNMPIQHIKSEFIIKLHSVMNGLQLLE
jgi:hypothetical protein